MEPLEKLEYDYEQWDSDQDNDLRAIDSDDSEDEVAVDLLQRLTRCGAQLPDTRPIRKKQGDEEDEFEREVNAELEASLQAHQAESCARSAAAGEVLSGSGPPPSQPAKQTGTKQVQFYDDIYFDSDDSLPDTATEPDTVPSTRDTGVGSGPAVTGARPDLGSAPAGTASKRQQRRRERRRVLSNDELFYDPELDDRDQQWVDGQRQRYMAPTQTRAGRDHLSWRPQKLPHSDAVLNCPACMTMLCLDCQRHELYSNQYRAMFVFNCAVDTSQALRYREKKPRRSGRRARQRAESDAAGSEQGELYNPVQCSTCKTEVAVYDKEEVYHFFNVIASHS